MNSIRKLYCRLFQFVFKLALPVLPYRNPKIMKQIEDLPSLLKKNQFVRPLIVTDEGIYKLGLTNSLETLLKNEKISFYLYANVVANPTTQQVEEAMQLYLYEKCDCLIGLGGGSAIDCAKAVGARIARPKKTLNQLKGILKIRKKIPFLIAIPTTAGTGSETTLAAVIVDSKTRHKYAINDFPLIPRVAVLDEAFTASLPKFVVATTGLDALTHAIEAFLGKSGNRSTKKDALNAMKLIFNYLEPAYFTGDEVSRRQMLYAAHLAGRSFSKAYVGYVHAIAHSLGGAYNIPHGLANAVLLPIVLKQYGKVIYKKLYQIAVYCQLADENTSLEVAAQRIIEKIELFNKKFSIPSKFPIEKKDIEQLASYADKEANPLYPVPVLYNRLQLMDIYLKAGDFK